MQKDHQPVLNSLEDKRINSKLHFMSSMWHTLFKSRSLLMCIRGSLIHYAAQAERSLPEFLLRGERRGPLKYIMSVHLSNFEYFIEKMLSL